MNIPAVSTAGVPDALMRDCTGVAMVSAIGRTAAQFREIESEVGSRAWAAMYLGTPSSPTGGLIKAAWLDDWRLPAAPAGAMKIVVGVDPADSGQGDETGIIAAGTTYVRLVTEALAKYRLNHPVKASSWPPRGSQRGKGDAVARATGLLAALETGRAQVAGFLPEFEREAVGWQSDQHQPDRVAAAVVAFVVLAHAVVEPMHIVSPLDIARRARQGQLSPPPPWMRRRLGSERA